MKVLEHWIRGDIHRWCGGEGSNMSDLEHAGAATDRPEAAEAPEQPSPGTEQTVETTTEVTTTTPTPDTGVAQNDQAESEDDGA